MAIIGIPTTKDLGNGAWEVQALSTLESPTFYAYRHGVFSSQNQTGRFLFQLQDGEHLRVDIVDDLDDAPEPGYPGRAVLQWDEAVGATSYRIEQFIDAAWTQVSLIQASSLSVYEWVSNWLDNLTTYQFRVVPVVAGNDGYPREFTFEMHRRPDRPVVDAFAYDDGTNTITATVS